MSTVGIGEVADNDARRGAVLFAARGPQEIMVSPRGGESAGMVLVGSGHGQTQRPGSRRRLPAPVAHSLDLMVH